MVRDSILTQEEKINLDKELEIVELDNALEHANSKSAPGVDGFTYGFTVLGSFGIFILMFALMREYISTYCLTV